jgi:hypothetical protein
MSNKLYILTLLLSFSVGNLFSQDDFSDEVEQAENKTITVSGIITDSNTGRPLAGANVVIEGTELGAASDEEGSFSIAEVEVGSSLNVSVIGYADLVVYADQESIEIALVPDVLEMSQLEVLASRAGENTAVAYTNVSKSDLALRLGSRDIPLALNTMPSVYSTGQGGGAGDARINVRGFNQRNIAIMINGVPVNDMENGWVYWSNWDGLADATSSIQMQKGLSAQNLATPSIGGSMNVITDPSSQERGGSFKQEIGAWGFAKTTLSYHSGLLLDDKLSMSSTLVRKTGKGYHDGTWTDAYAYFFDAVYNLNDNHRFQFYALGAPQQHGQNRYKQNVGAYVSSDSDFMKKLMDDGFGYETAALAENGGEFMAAGRDFNQNTAEISESSQAILDGAGGQHWQMYSVQEGVDRHEKGRLNERMNFFHKPQAALNHYWNIQDNMRLTSSAYWSGGMGGGSGHYGDISRIDADGISDLRAEKHKFYYGPSPWVWDYDGTIAANASSSENVVIFQGDTVSRGNQESIGILRNSNNRQSTLGLLSKLSYDVNDNLRAEVGLDWRTAKIYHVKTIRDLLGGSYFVNNDSDFDDAGTQKSLGDPIDYNFTNTVDWLGLFGQGEYSSGSLSAYAMAGYTTINYSHWNHFQRGTDYTFANSSSKDGSGSDWIDGGGNDGELFIEADAVSSTQLKGGVLYGLGDAMSFFSAIPVFGKTADNTDIWFNFGLIDKAPVMDQVIYEDDGEVFYSADAANEKFNAFELGLNFASNDGLMAAKLNVYSTQWTDRVQTKTVQDQGSSSDDNVVFLSGINQSHTGLEIEYAAQVHPLVRLDIAAGFGNWVFTDDATGTYRDGDDGEVSYSYALKDLKVGDMPQTNFALGTTITPVDGLRLQLIYKHYLNHTSDWSVSDREYSDEANADRTASWVAPSYGLVDLHGTYDLPLDLGSTKPKLFFHAFNLLDAVYIQDAVDNSAYNSWDKNHNADDAEVFMGLPFRFNAGLSVSF